MASQMGRRRSTRWRRARRRPHCRRPRAAPGANPGSRVAMNWKQRYRLRSFFRSSLWPVPLACMAAAPAVARLTLWVDHQVGWTLNVAADDARAVANTLVGSLLAFIVFIFTSLLVSVQLASAQFSPRVIARVFKDRYTKAALSVFVFSYTYSLVLLSRVKDPVPLVSGVLCGYGSLACMAVFLLLIDRLGKELRPVRILAAVAAEGRKAIQGLYPQLLIEVGGAKTEPPSLGDPCRVVNHRGDPGVVLAFDDEGLLKIARRADCVVELVPQVGDFLAPEDPLFRIYQGGQAVDEELLHRS